MEKIIRYFPLNKGIEAKSANSLWKTIGKYILVCIVSYIIMRLVGIIPFIGNLIYRIYRILEYYFVAGMLISCYQCFSRKDFRSVTYIGKADFIKLWSYKQCKIAVLIVALDLSSFDTSNVTDMVVMFRDCSSLISLDISSFDTDNVTDMAEMFRGCNNLKEVLVGSGWNTEQAETKNIFLNCGVSEVTYK